jgi:hypothetical protein
MRRAKNGREDLRLDSFSHSNDVINSSVKIGDLRGNSVPKMNRCPKTLDLQDAKSSVAQQGKRFRTQFEGYSRYMRGKEPNRGSREVGKVTGVYKGQSGFEIRI